MNHYLLNMDFSTIIQKGRYCGGFSRPIIITTVVKIIKHREKWDIHAIITEEISIICGYPRYRPDFCWVWLSIKLRLVSWNMTFNYSKIVRYTKEIVWMFSGFEVFLTMNSSISITLTLKSSLKLMYGQSWTENFCVEFLFQVLYLHNAFTALSICQGLLKFSQSHYSNICIITQNE